MFIDGGKEAESKNEYERKTQKHRREKTCHMEGVYLGY